VCTVSFIARKHGYCLAMNRDEKLTRAQGLPPVKSLVAGRLVLCPFEPGGGTWIAVNDAGVCFALINWYAVKSPFHPTRVTRGEVVNRVKAQALPAQSSDILKQLPLKQMSPFRVIGIFPARREIYEWRWDSKRLDRRKHQWLTRQFISSGFDEPTAQRVRSYTFHRSQRQRSSGSLDWLRRLHRSHSPKRGPFSTCMHRLKAATVSYTELIVSTSRATMRYRNGAPCQQCALSIHVIPRGNSGCVIANLRQVSRVRQTRDNSK
jgi:hypothetical protein